MPKQDAVMRCFIVKHLRLRISQRICSYKSIYGCTAFSQKSNVYLHIHVILWERAMAMSKGGRALSRRWPCTMPLTFPGIMQRSSVLRIIALCMLLDMLATSIKFQVLNVVARHKRTSRLQLLVTAPHSPIENSFQPHRCCMNAAYSGNSR